MSLENCGYKNYWLKASIVAFGGIVIAAGMNIGFASEVQQIPEHRSPVIDTIGLLDKTTNAKLANAMEDVYQAGGPQLGLLVVSSTLPEPIEQYAIRVADLWQLGREKNDDGLIFVLAIEDRKLRIEVGQGLEGSIPDVIAKRIIDQQMTPQFAAGDFEGGIFAGISSALYAIDPKYEQIFVKSTDLKRSHRSEATPRSSWAQLFKLLGLAIAWIFVFKSGLLGSGTQGPSSGMRTRGHWGRSYRGTRSGWGGSFGGGFGGGGGGGFGGGGGGGFSGGGASGRW